MDPFDAFQRSDLPAASLEGTEEKNLTEKDSFVGHRFSVLRKSQSTMILESVPRRIMQILFRNFPIVEATFLTVPLCSPSSQLDWVFTPQATLEHASLAFAAQGSSNMGYM